MSEFRASSTVVKTASGLQVVQVAADEWALVVLSATGSTKVTLYQYKGASAQADIQTLYQLYSRIFEVTGLEP